MGVKREQAGCVRWIRWAALRHLHFLLFSAFSFMYKYVFVQLFVYLDVKVRIALVVVVVRQYVTIPLTDYFFTQR